MTNKSHAITISLFRIGVLAAQIAVSPFAAAQSTAGAGSQQPAARAHGPGKRDSARA
jgi:hypothetical protein